MACYRNDGCVPYEGRPCSECPASKPEYALRYQKQPASPAVNTEPQKGCEICNGPAKWAAVFGHEHKFGFPFLFARKQFFEDGKIKASFCPLCGRKLEDG